MFDRMLTTQTKTKLLRIKETPPPPPPLPILSVRENKQINNLSFLNNQTKIFYKS